MPIWLRLDAHAGPDHLGPHVHETDAEVRPGFAKNPPHLGLSC